MQVRPVFRREEQAAAAAAVREVLDRGPARQGEASLSLPRNDDDLGLIAAERV